MRGLQTGCPTRQVQMSPCRSSSVSVTPTGSGYAPADPRSLLCPYSAECWSCSMQQQWIAGQHWQTLSLTLFLKLSAAPACDPHAFSPSESSTAMYQQASLLSCLQSLSNMLCSRSGWSCTTTPRSWRGTPLMLSSRPGSRSGAVAATTHKIYRWDLKCSSACWSAGTISYPRQLGTVCSNSSMRLAAARCSRGYCT